MVALAFLPPSMRKKTAKLYSGRLELRYAVQKRQLRSFHVDGHYNNALRLYAKHFSVEKAAVFISYDDKAKVRISVFYYFYVKIKAFI